MNAWQLVHAASRVGAWLLADEVYAGAERLTDDPTPSFWGEVEKVIAVGSLSKAYGLPGLRLGWLAAPPEFTDQAWARQDYITISSSILSNKLALLCPAAGYPAQIAAAHPPVYPQRLCAFRGVD